MATFFSPVAIKDHLLKYLPQLTDRFSDNALVSAEIITGVPQTLRVTDIAHGLSAGSLVVLIDGKIDNPIVSVTDNGDGTIRFQTQNPHDLTAVYTPEIELSGFTDSAFNGIFPLFSVPSRTLFEIESASLPVLNGNEVLREVWEIGINGVFTIDSVVDVDTYDILLTDKPVFTPQTVPILKRASNFNLGITVDAERAKALYTPQPDNTELWLFIIMGDAGASKDRTLKSDATQSSTSGQESRILMINTFTLLVFFPTKNETAAGVATNLAWDEILKVMLAAGAGIKFDDFGNTQFVTSLIDHGASVYANSYYSHAYTFEYNYQITQEQEFLTQFIESRAFRDNAISFSEPTAGSTIDLDEEST